MREAVVDLAAIGVAALVAMEAAGTAEILGTVTGGTLFFALVLSGVGCLALWWRRRWPVGVALLLAAIMPITEFVGAAVLIAVYTVTANRRWPVSLAVAGLHVVAFVPYSLHRPDPDLGILGANVLHVALLSIAVAVGTVVRAQREKDAVVRERAEAEARLHLDRVRVLERERIAREMHDVLAHRISLVSLHAGALEVRSDLSAEEIARAARTIRVGAHEALEDLREILGVLRAAPDSADGLRPQPGLADLDRLVADVRAAGTVVEVENLLPDVAPPAAASRTAYRVLQEGLTNARKHAPGSEVRIRLDRAPDGELRVRMCNRLVPVGGPVVPGARVGLAGLSERVGLGGGWLEHGVRRTPDGELVFQLAARLPWPG
ncbi:histidine kinase [Polymorphospora sp. NPDC050346]|uniref:sensor histidine kinase n=1 Tax=Polymorphospora sp. NPDC050346 TaxID=3155780 RepID=UPI0034033FF1